MSSLSRSALAISVLSSACSWVQAQAVDQYEVRREGSNAVLQLRFATEIQFRNAVTTRSGDLTLIFYSLVTTNNSAWRDAQSLRFGSGQGLPDLDLTDDSDTGTRNRKIVLRTGSDVRVDVRAGAGNRSIEIVLKGVGAGVGATQSKALRRGPTPAPVAASGVATAPVTPATLPQADRRFVIVLQSLPEPNFDMATPIPRGLDSYDLFTAERDVDGQRRFEIQLGHFASRTQAEAVLRRLSAFPQANIVATAPLLAEASRPTAAPVAAASAPTAATDPTPPQASAPTPTPAPAPVAIAAPPTEPTLGIGPSTAEIDAKAGTLLATAQAAMARQNPVDALGLLNELLNLPPNRNTRAAQELAGLARARSGDLARARIEFETYLQLYPTGEGSDRVRRELAALQRTAAPAPAAPVVAKADVDTALTGSISASYLGGNGQVRSQDFKDSPVAGLPQTAGDPQFSPDKSRQLLNDVDINWRRRDTYSDTRFVFRDSYTTDLERSEKSKNRLSSLYFDYKALGADGYGVRLGRQSPLGGGVSGRFDGISGNYLLRPKLKLGAVAGQPTDKIFESKRKFYGVSLDADGFLPNVGASTFLIQQTLDGEIDRRAIGLDLRYFKGDASVFAQFDYDTLIKGLNVATVQGTLILEDNTVYNALYDRRALTPMTLSNALQFSAAGDTTLYTSIAQRLANTTALALREQIKRTTPFITQAQLGFSKPMDKNWQVGASGQLTNTGAVPPVPEVEGFQAGRPATGNIYTVSGQLIGLNLFSERDTHVLATSVIHSPLLTGFLLSYNNSSTYATDWQLEPSLQFYRDRSTLGSTSQRWTPGLRVTYRGWQRLSIESSLTCELGKASRVATTVDANDPTLTTTTTTTKENSNRVNYSLGARYEF